MSRTVTGRWNLVNRCGALGDFLLLQSDQYEKSGIMIRMVIKRTRCYGSVTRSWTAARKNGLHLPEEEASPNKQKGLDRTSFGDAVMALTVYQFAETRLQHANNARVYPEAADDNNSISNGSMSLDFGENVAVWLPNKPGLGR